MAPQTHPCSSPDDQEEILGALGIDGSNTDIVITQVSSDLEELLPDGTRRRRRYTNTSILLRSRGRRVRIPRWLLTISVAVFLIVAIMIIGLIAVGPKEVWNETKDIIPKLIP